MAGLGYCLNMVTRQEYFTLRNVFHSSDLLIFFSFSHVFTTRWSPPFDKLSLIRADKGRVKKYGGKYGGGGGGWAGAFGNVVDKKHMAYVLPSVQKWLTHP